MPLVSLPADVLLDLALNEDLAYGDITTDNLFSSETLASAQIVSRQSAILSGSRIAKTVFGKIDSRVDVQFDLEDGAAMTAGTVIASLSGPVSGILKAERLALNFLQHLSGVATLTYQYVGAVSGTGTQITHTRKTIPGLRELEIEAVVHGGGSPHRKSLSHAALIKDNHIHAAGGILQAVAKLRKAVGHTVRMEVECDTLAQVDEALEAGADIVLLDNMSIAMLEEAVKKAKGKAITEASGGITLSSVLEIAQTGVDIISTSQITLSAPAIDIGLDF